MAEVGATRSPRGPAAVPLSPEQRAEAGARGSLGLKDRAVERLVLAAAREVPGVAAGDATTSALGTTLGNALGRGYPRVECDVAGRRVRTQVEIVTHWPQPAARIAAAVRDHVADRLRVLADLDVDSVEVRVAQVVRPSTPEKRRVQ